MAVSALVPAVAVETPKKNKPRILFGGVPKV
jgi:hypothetical protein